MDALVVGAGPTGLLMAGELARHGLAVRIIDRDEHGATESRALAIQARTVEVLDDLGLADRFLAEGLRASGVNFWGGAGKHIAHVDLDEIPGPYPFVLDLPQARTEALLAEHLSSLGPEVERQTELVAFEQDTDGVRATLRSPSGEETVEVPWLVGCDGAHSVVRHTLAIPFEGRTVAIDWALADVAVEWSPAPGEMHMFLLTDGLLAAFPMPAGRWRLIAEIGEADEDKPPPTPDLEFFVDYLERCGHPDGKVSDPHWLAAFRVNERQATHIRDRRAFLVGDAAHVHSPAGGQGMNTGLQDAYNLAWKLALVQREHAPRALLDTYELERHPVAERVVKQTSALFKLALIRGPAAQKLRDAVLRHLASIAPIQRRIVTGVSERDINYRDSPIVAEHHRPPRAPHAGDLAPDDTADMRKLLRGTEHVLIAFDGAEPLGSLVAKKYRGLVRCHWVTSVEAVTMVMRECEVVFDSDGAIREAFGGAALCVVRPDGYIGFIAGEADEAALRGYIETVLTPPDEA